MKEKKEKIPVSKETKKLSIITGILWIFIIYLFVPLYLYYYYPNAFDSYMFVLLIFLFIWHEEPTYLILIFFYNGNRSYYNSRKVSKNNKTLSTFLIISVLLGGFVLVGFTIKSHLRDKKIYEEDKD